MDIEKNRIPMRITPPYIPVRFGTLLHRLPVTAKSDGRAVGCITGWALKELGVPETILSANRQIGDALKAAKPYAKFPRDLFSKVAEAHDNKQVKAAAKLLAAELNTHGIVLSSIFGSFKVSALKTKVAKMLADYEAVDAPPVYRRK